MNNMKSAGQVLFWVGLILIVGVTIAYLILMLIPSTDPIFSTWIASLALCGIVLIGAVLILIGRNLERKSGDYI